MPTRPSRSPARRDPPPVEIPPARRDPPPPLPPDLAATLPFQRRCIEVRGRAIHLIDHTARPDPGASLDAPPTTVICVHGNPTWSFLWRKVLRRLRGVRAIAPDLLGFGLSDKPRRIRFHSVDAHIDHLHAAIEAIDPGQRIVAVGQDWGGPIACGLAERFDRQGRLHGVVLGNTAVLPPRRPARATTFHRFAHLPLLSELAFVGLGFPLQVLARTQGDPTSIGSLEARAYRYPLSRPWDRAGPLALARMVPHREGHPSLARPRSHRRAGCEAWEGSGGAGVGSATTRSSAGRSRACGRPGPRRSVTETDAGHFLQEEVPDALADAIRSVAAA